MKVILAGYPKTGTKSIATALTVLGYEVYDYMEHFWYHGKQWEKLLTGKGNLNDFRDMYEDVDAITDTPVYFFWEEIHKVFPDSLIVLTVRDEEAWLKSWCSQMQSLKEGYAFRLIWLFSPHGRSLHRHFDRHCVALFGFGLPFFWSAPQINELMMKSRYRQHNLNVLQNAPKDKLLVYNVADGWEPLCKFLGKPVPDLPFPRKNRGATVYKTLLKENTIMKQLHRETMAVGGVCCVLSVFAAYKLYTSGRLSNLISHFYQVASRLSFYH